MRQWVCGFNSLVSYTPRGRAWNYASTPLGTTANAAFLATVYGKFVLPSITAKSQRYTCWALGQIRYILGDAGQSLVVGYGKDPPSACANQAASCPTQPAACNAVTAKLSPTANPEARPTSQALAELVLICRWDAAHGHHAVP